MLGRINSIYWPIYWPIVVKVPLAVGFLLIFLGVMVSNAVLTKLSSTQETHLDHLSQAYLDGISTAVRPHILRNDAWEVFDVLDRAESKYETVRIKSTIVTMADNTVLAASIPTQYPIDSKVPENIIQRFAGTTDLIIDEKIGNAWVVRDFKEGKLIVGRVYAEIDFSEQLKVRRDTFWALTVMTMMITLIFASLGYALVRKMLRPLSILDAHVSNVTDGDISYISDSEMPKSKGELRNLMTRFNVMAQALKEREELANLLAEEEKLIMLGKLASAMAHEVNNPLGGMGNAIDTIRKHGDEKGIRERALDIIERGLAGIANVARATLATYKGTDQQEPLSRRDIEDLKFLIRHKLERKDIQLIWKNTIVETLSVDVTATRQIVLNLLLNACEASPPGGVVGFSAEPMNGFLAIMVNDQGEGIPDAVADQLRNARVSVLPGAGHGLGAWTVGTLLARHDGKIEIDTSDGYGTTIHVQLPLREMKRKNNAAA